MVRAQGHLATICVADVPRPSGPNTWEGTNLPIGQTVVATGVTSLHRTRMEALGCIPDVCSALWSPLPPAAKLRGRYLLWRDRGRDVGIDVLYQGGGGWASRLPRGGGDFRYRSWLRRWRDGMSGDLCRSVSVRPRGCGGWIGGLCRGFVAGGCDRTGELCRSGVTFRTATATSACLSSSR